MACGIFPNQESIEPGVPAVKALSPTHWTDREFPGVSSMKTFRTRVTLLGRPRLRTVQSKDHSCWKVQVKKHIPWGLGS